MPSARDARAHLSLLAFPSIVLQLLYYTCLMSKPARCRSQHSAVPQTPCMSADGGPSSAERVPFPQDRGNETPCRATPLRRQVPSDYVLLKRVDSSYKTVPLPRPRYWFALPLLGLLDAAVTVIFVSRGGIGRSAASKAGFAKDEIALLAWALLRAVTVLGACSSTRVREVGWLIVGGALVSGQTSSNT